MELLRGDCLELMKEIPDGSVDMILADPPYGTTDKNEWDKIIPLKEMFENYNRVIKDNGAVVVFSQLPFAVDVINENRRYFRYEIIWHKTQAVGFLNANRMPLRAHENILVFYKRLPTYNPQKTKGIPYNRGLIPPNCTPNYGNFGEHYVENKTGDRHPLDVITFSSANRAKHHLHPTQKPVALLEYLIRTYTNPGEVVLDNCMGSGSTGIACVNTGRDFVGIEKDDNYFRIAAERIRKAEEEQMLAYTE